MKARRIIILVAVLIGACWLLYAAIGKLESPSGFASLVEAHGLIPAALAPHIAWAVILLELLLATSALWWTLALNMPSRALYTLAGTFVVFASYAALLVYYPPPEPTGCGCAGSSAADLSPADWRQLALRNSGVATGFVLVAWVLPKATEEPETAQPEAESDADRA